MHSIGSRIKIIRKALKFNQLEFSKLISISQGTLSDIENNKFNPSLKTIESIVTSYSICANWILQGECQYHTDNNNCPYYATLKELKVCDSNIKNIQ